MAIDMAQFHQVFFEESFEGLDIMESGLLSMDPGAVDSETINAVFRAAHSIKGGAGTFGFNTIAGFTHVMETLLDEMRDGRRPVTPGAVTVLLKSVDVLREMLTAAQQGTEPDAARIQAQQQALEHTLRHGDAQPAPAPAPVKAAPAPEPVPISASAEPVLLGWHIVFAPHRHLLRTGNDPLRILAELHDLGPVEVEGDVSALPR